jgi:hypothetical protein
MRVFASRCSLPHPAPLLGDNLALAHARQLPVGSVPRLYATGPEYLRAVALATAKSTMAMPTLRSISPSHQAL